MTRSHLIFDSSIGKQKPETIVNRQNPCPFCNVEALTHIMDQKDSIIWLENKYPVLQDAFQTVIIETDECTSELSLYSKEHLHKLIDFALKKWKEMQENSQYKSVLFFKNHGPMSGGSLRHPHMQIVGLKNVDAYRELDERQFEGLTIHEENGVIFNLSTLPRVGFFEFNVCLKQGGEQTIFADLLQTAVHYVLHHFHRNCTSYNLFFYPLENKEVVVKILPRFSTSPLFMGYDIAQVSNKLSDVVHQVQELYFSQKK